MSRNQQIVFLTEQTKQKLNPNQSRYLQDFNHRLIQCLHKRFRHKLLNLSEKRITKNLQEWTKKNNHITYYSSWKHYRDWPFAKAASVNPEVRQTLYCCSPWRVARRRSWSLCWRNSSRGPQRCRPAGTSQLEHKKETMFRLI